MSKVKTIGLVGGLGPASTQIYYKKLTDTIYKDVGIFPHLFINSVPMNELKALFEAERYDEATDYLNQQIKILQHSGAELIAIASNTPHIVIDDLRLLVDAELISIVDVAVEAAVKSSVDKVGVLGTRFTMKGGFYQKAFSEVGILASTPRTGYFAYINEKIFTELANGIINDKTFEQFYKIEALILAYTELSLLFKNEIPGIKIIDTAEEHINYIAKRAVSL